MKALQYFVEFLGWLRIVASPLVTGLIIGGLVYLSHQTKTGIIIGTAIASAGLIAGIIGRHVFGKNKAQ